jgi:hypothetical protein
MENRCLTKRFLCNNCDKRFRKLVSYNDDRTSCDDCSGEAHVIEENEFNREEADRIYRMRFDHSNLNEERQYHPTTDILDRDPSNIYGDARRRVRQHAHEIPNQQRPTTQQGQTTRVTQARQPTVISTMNREIFSPYSISPFRGSVRRHHFDNIFGIFDNFFNIPNNDFFMDNFASNFSSNFDNPFTRIVFIQSMRNQPSGNPPTSKNYLKNLKKFKMSEEFCKKDKKDNLEYPTCSVCISEMAKGEDTIMVPCGHMFHESCVMKWLQSHNSCPVCRYELPTDDPDYERSRQQRMHNNQNPNTNSNNGNNV